MKTVHIHRYLFWLQDNTVCAVHWYKGKYEILKPEGESSVPFTEDYWKTWKEYAGWCEDDRTDFCFICDSEPGVDEELLEAHCDKGDCAWNCAAIAKAVQCLGIKEPAEIRNEAGDLVARVGKFSRKNKDVLTLTAYFEMSRREADVPQLEPKEQTCLIRGMLKELQEYKEQCW